MFLQNDTAIICLAVLLAVYADLSRNFRKGNPQERSFRACVVIVILALVLDILIHLTVLIPLPPVLSHLLMTIYYAVVVVAVAGWFQYTSVIIFGRDTKPAGRMLLYAAVPCAIYLIFVISNPWTGLLYTLDANGVYTRGPWFSLHAFTFLFYTLWILLMAALRWKYIPTPRLRFLLLFLPLLLCVGVLLQILLPGQLMMFPCYTVVLLICYLSIQTTRTRDIIAKNQLEVQRLSNAASVDGLTGLYNRSAAQAAIDHLVEHNHGKGCVLILADLDDLKHINDTYGHIIGDQALGALADVMRKLFRSSDILARVGGDEFMIFLPDVADPELLRPKLALLVETLSSQYVGEDAAQQLHGSFGAASGIMGIDDTKVLLEQADAALYHAKRNGKNQYAFFSPGMQVNPQR